MRQSPVAFLQVWACSVRLEVWGGPAVASAAFPVPDEEMALLILTPRMATGEVSLEELKA